jgi:hypothetical protein
MVLVIAVAVGGAFSALVRYDLIGFGHLPRAALYPVFLLILLNALVIAFRKRQWFNTRRLAYIYVAILVMAGFPGQQLVTYLYLTMIGAQGYATPENKYVETFMQYVPAWMVPSTDPESPAIRWAMQGVPMGRGMPWQPWVWPLLAWTPVLISVLVIQMTLAVWFRKRWADQERVLFPLARIPVDMIQYDNPTAAWPACFRSPWFWMAFAVPVLLYSKNALHYYFPGIPETKLMNDIGVVFPSRPWSVLNGFQYNTYFEMMGITYLVQDDMGFSLWFFWIFRKLVMVAREGYGIGSHDDFFTQQGLGAYVLLVGVYLWLARAQIKDVYRKAVYNDASIDDSREPMSYRTAFWGFWIAVAVFLGWARTAGAGMWYTGVFLLLYLVSSTVLTRLVAEGGMFAVWTPFIPPDQEVNRIFGPKIVGARTTTILRYLGSKMGDSASSTMANILQGYKVGDLADLHPRSTAIMIFAALVVALFASHPSALYAIYSRSVPDLGWWPKTAFVGFGSGLVQFLQAPQIFTGANYANMALGAGFTLFLQIMRQRYTWWFFHPLAYVAIAGGPEWMGDRYGFSIVVGWTVRKIVQRFGGYHAYNTVRPAAIGIIAGNAVVLLTWSIVHYFHPITGVLITE